MDEVELEVAVYGEGIVFPVMIARAARVSELQEAIVNKKKDVNHRFNVDPALVTLYLARKNGTWLKDDDSLDDLLSGERIDTRYRKMRSSWQLTKTEYFGDFQLEGEEVHILVKLPEASAGVELIRTRAFWLVTGSAITVERLYTQLEHLHPR
nr:crinkler 34 [Plasmopara viticola]